jgi:hypothetical protein
VEKEPRSFDGKTDLMEYLSYFRKIGKLNGWDYETCGLQLATSLVGDAALVLSTLSLQQSENWDCLVQALVAKYCPKGREIKYSYELFSRCKEDNETVTEFCHALLSLARKAYPGMIVPERIMIDLFKRGLISREMQLQVHLRVPQTLAEAVEVAVVCETFDALSQVENKDEEEGGASVVVANESGEHFPTNSDTPCSYDRGEPDIDIRDEELKREFFRWRERQMKETALEMESARVNEFTD